MPDKTIRLTVDLPPDLHHQYKLHCQIKSTTMQSETEQMIKRRVQLAEYSEEEQRLKDMLS